MRIPGFFIALAMSMAIFVFIAMASANADSVQIIHGKPGDTISYTGTGTPGAQVTLEVSGTVTVATTSSGSDTVYSYSIQGLHIPSPNSMSLTVSPVNDMKITVNCPLTLGVDVTVDGSVNGVTGTFSKSVPESDYNIRVHGTAHDKASQVTMSVSASQQATVGSNGKYTVSLNTKGLPAAIYTLKQGGAKVAEIRLGTSDSYNLNLNKGWNLISLPLVPEDGSVTSVFTPDVMKDIRVIWTYESSGGSDPWRFYTPLSGYKPNTLSTISERKAYWVYSQRAMTVTVWGKAPASDTISMNELSNGWNFIGYPSMSARSPASIYGTARVVWGYENGQWKFYTPLPGYSSNTLDSLKPGNGYWVYKK